MISHVSILPLPVQRTLQIPHRPGNRHVQNVNDASALTPHIHDVSPHGTDAERPLIRRLSSTTREEGGPVQHHLAASELYDARFEFPRIRIIQKQFFCHSAIVPCSWFLNVATSR